MSEKKFGIPEEKHNEPQSTRRGFLRLVAGVVVPQAFEAANKWAPSLSGIDGSIARKQNMARSDELSYTENREQVENFVEKGLLVALPENDNIQVDPNLPEWRRYCRPWVRDFLIDLSGDFKKIFPNAEKIMVTSAVRPADLQRQLTGRNKKGRRVNPNASTRSTHPTGATIDIAYGKIPKHGSNVKIALDAKKQTIYHYNGMTSEQRTAVEAYLLAMERIGKIEATKEYSQPCYDVMVSKKYSENRGKRPIMSVPAKRGRKK